MEFKTPKIKTHSFENCSENDEADDAELNDSVGESDNSLNRKSIQVSYSQFPQYFAESLTQRLSPGKPQERSGIQIYDGYSRS